MIYTLFLTDAESLEEVISVDRNTLRMDGVTESDAKVICEMGEKYGFTVAAFLSTEKG